VDDVRRGVLRVTGKATGYGGHQPWAGLKLSVTDENGTSHRVTEQPHKILPASLRHRPPAELNDHPIDFVLGSDGSYVRTIREADPNRPSATGTAPGLVGTRSGWVRPRDAERAASSGRPPSADAFHNPYTFVPVLPRATLAAGSELADGPPIGHDVLHADRWTGQLAVTMTAHTPLLLLDTAQPRTLKDDDEHKIYGPLLRDGRLHLPSTAVKGMLRAAYEAVTNSRLGIFTGHDTPLGYRGPARAGLVPARVGPSGHQIDLLLGTCEHPFPSGGEPLQFAAWLPRYDGDVPDKGQLRHGERVRMHLRLVRHHRWNRRTKEHEANFRYWRVVAVGPPGRRLPPLRKPARQDPRPGSSYHELLDDTLPDVEGTVFITNRNISGKHDERVFFGKVEAKHVPSDVFRSYELLIENYIGAHRPADITERRGLDGSVVSASTFIGKDPGKTAWSPHLYDKERTGPLKPGELCYAELDPTGRVIGLYPVLISRRLYQSSPQVDRSLLPARSRSELSPADRVFGWVNPAGHGAHRGQLRIGPVDTTGARTEPIGPRDGDGFPLAILGQPKPQQGRFYATRPAPRKPPKSGRGHDREPRPPEKSVFYADGTSIRGRKVYLHHAGLPESYWANPAEDRTQDLVEGRYQEYRRPRKETHKDGPLIDSRKFATLPDTEQRDSQNRSITGWVAPGSTFRVTVEVTNLSDVELGALLWLLRLPADHYHRLGLGKPLGFGSMRLELDEAGTVLRRGEDWRAFYATFADTPPGSDPALDDLVKAFDTATHDAWPAKPHLRAFLNAAKGDPAVPVHYPRTRPEGDPPFGMDRNIPVPPDPRGRAYAWFTANEEVRGRVLTRAESLPSAEGKSLDPLPVYSEKVRASEGGRSGQPGRPDRPQRRASAAPPRPPQPRSSPRGRPPRADQPPAR